MLKIDWAKIDKFYLVLIVILVFMAIILILAFKGVFSAYLTAYEIDQGGIDTELRIDKEKLDKAYKWAFDKQSVSLEIKD